MGVHDVKDLNRIGNEFWQEAKRDRREAAAERERVSALNILTKAEMSGVPLCGTWRVEDSGWTKIEVVMDSGQRKSFMQCRNHAEQPDPVYEQREDAR